MKPIKYIEVILPEAVLQAFTDMVDKHAFEAYSVCTGLSGKSSRGIATAGLSDARVTILYDQQQADLLVREIGLFIAHYGGIGCVIEADGYSISVEDRNT